MKRTFAKSCFKRFSRKLNLFLMCLLSISCIVLYGCKPNIEKLMQEGKNAFYSKDYVKAKNAFYKCAEQGDSQGQFWLAQVTFFTGGHYSDTDTLTMSSEEINAYVHDLYKKSAEQKDGDGYAGLYLCYSAGLGVIKDSKKAMEYLDKSVGLNSSFGNAEKGHMLLFANDGTKDIKKGFELAKKSADANDYYGIKVLATCYLMGIGVPEDLDKGLELLEESARHNCRMAKDVLASLYFFGHKNIETNYNKAVSYANEGSMTAKNLYILGFCNYFGEGVDKNEQLGATYIRECAKLGFVGGQRFWASLCQDGYGTMEEAFDWYMKAAEQGDEQSTAKVGEFLLMGKAGETDYKKAKKYLNKAASSGSELAQELLNTYSFILNYY